ncbi:MAG TPA: alpha/beta fold hydrolase [Beutenbergiaceae bacterium]|nr:alpha/beta fold hydrolase [Beutenbergiaceae bacterium]
MSTTDTAGRRQHWHVLDNGPTMPDDEPVRATLLCVHGNPTWSYLWRRVIAQAPPGWRVIAPDHLEMGFSQRTGQRRTLRQRIDDLGQLTEELDVGGGPVVLLAHDWGGPIGLGWALEHTDQLAGVVLTNTAVHQPAGSPAPSAIRLARAPGVLDLVCRRTPTFVRATTAVSRPALPSAIRRAFAAPYHQASHRVAVGDFVADIPLEPGHRSMAALQQIQSGLPGLADVPSLLVWGPSDPVFSQRYLQDMIARLPHADVHRYPGASHLVLEDRPEATEVIWDWINTRTGPAAAPTHTETGATGEDLVPIAVDTRRPGHTAIAELGTDPRQITFGELDQRVADIARGLYARGVQPGHRVAVLVPPGIDLTSLVYALWRLRAVVVVADPGLGIGRLVGALHGTGTDFVVGISRALMLARATGVPAARIRFERDDVPDLVREGAGGPLPPAKADLEADGAILFTSGATGPPKGVVYSRRRLSAQVALLRNGFGFGPEHRFVAAFAPFALYGPALGMASVVPDMDVTAPHTLSATALAQAVEQIGASVVFASPAALRNIVATAGNLTGAERKVLTSPELVLSAGAPVPTSLLEQVKQVLPRAATHTPYGMTEALPVSTLDPTTLNDPPPARGRRAAAPAQRPGTERGAATSEGVCVGTPLPGVQVRINPIGADRGVLESAPEVLGEILVRGPHTKSRYDRLWATQQASAFPPGWHRTGDAGRFDDQGRLWVQGRLAHLLHTPHGPVPPYGPEQRIEALARVQAAALVGVGPPGTQQAVAVIVPQARLGRCSGSPLAPAALTAQVRQVAGVPIAAVLLKDWLPVDIRHASKVDRSALARWATRWLHGKRSARAMAPRTGSAPTTRSR